MRNTEPKSIRIWLILLIVASFPLILINCSGTESFEVDTTPPDKVILIPHLGDTGDSLYVNGVLVNDSNNGIDTVPADNNWIRIQWHTVLDPDLDYMRIYRFGDYSAVTLIHSLSRSEINQNEYLDNRLHHHNPVGQTWSYYVAGYDQHGNHSVSDTVSYKLLQKPILLNPPDSAQASLADTLSFEWYATNDAIHFRLLIFDQYDNYVWHYDYYEDEETEVTLVVDYMGPDLSGHDTIIWRVDSFDNINPDGIALSGAESYKRELHLYSP